MKDSLAQLTGRGSFSFTLGSVRFRGQAVCLSDYFAWTAMQFAPGTREHAEWYAPLLNERRKDPTLPEITPGWVLENVRVHQLRDLERILLEEEPPGDTWDSHKRKLTLGGIEFQAASYTLAEYGEYAKLGERPVNEDRIAEMARALRSRVRKGVRDPLEITDEWVYDTFSKPALRGLERLLATGRLASDPEPETDAGEGDGTPTKKS